MASNGWMRRHLPRLWFTKRAVRKFMPGETPAEALDGGETFKGQGMAVIFTRLGENLTDLKDADENAEAYLELMDMADKEG